jgi:TM2 domain-containing membrane protein YozV
VQPRLNGRAAIAAAAALAWFLFFPSLGIVQKYIGTAGAFACFGLAFLLIVLVMP